MRIQLKRDGRDLRGDGWVGADEEEEEEEEEERGRQARKLQEPCRLSSRERQASM